MPDRFLNCGGFVGYAEDVLYYLSRHFIGSGRYHQTFKDQRFWTDMFLAQVHWSLAFAESSAAEQALPPRLIDDLTGGASS